MRHVVSRLVTALAAAGCVAGADAATYSFDLAAAGVSGSVTLTYGTATDGKYPGAFEVTDASGTFSDAAAGIAGATIIGLVQISPATPETGNTLAPDDFSRYLVTAGLAHGSISYDNLYYPGGSPQTANSYPAQGGFLDIYGLLLNIGDGRSLNVWSNGTFGSGPVDYGVAVVTRASALDYVESGVSVAAVPEPGTYAMLAGGLLAVALARRRAVRRPVAHAGR